jgi:hypothetical protein
MSSSGTTLLVASVADRALPESFVASATSSAGLGITVFFTLYIGGLAIAANSVFSQLKGAGYGSAGSDWEDFLEALLGQSVTEYQRYALTWSDSVMSDQIITSDRANEIVALAFPTTDPTSSTQITFTSDTELRFPTFVSIPSISSTKFLVTYVFIIKPWVPVVPGYA